jgi:hypothetical protein
MLKRNCSAGVNFGEKKMNFRKIRNDLSLNFDISNDAECVKRKYHAASKLARTTFNKSPPKKKLPFFWGGGKFFGIFSQKKFW